MSRSSTAEVLLRSAVGFDDVGAIISMLTALPPPDVRPYLRAMLPSESEADAVADALGAPGGSAAAAASGGPVAYRKGDDDEPAAAGRTKAGRPAAACSIVGGAAAAPSKPSKVNKKGRQPRAGATTHDASLLPGRHRCRCNARRHELLYNCLACGSVVCAQEGEGPCLACGRDPHTPLQAGACSAAAPSSSETAALSAAEEHARRLIDFDRSAAKRTVVIDDQTEYFSHAAARGGGSAQAEGAQADDRHRKQARCEGGPRRWRR